MINNINAFDDRRIAPYQNLKDKQLAYEHGLFVVEGEFLVRRLLDSSFSTHSVLMTAKRFESADWDVPLTVPVYIASKEIISQIVGFDFHRGVLALGVRPENPNTWDDNITKTKRLLICPEINDVENLGSIMRTAAGLGYEHILLGESCCDPFARRAIRTSMGAVFKLKLYHSTDIINDIHRLKTEFGFELHASALDDKAKALDKVIPPDKLGLLLGSEAYGLPDEILNLANYLVTIPMAAKVDSLNVGVAAGILMYHYKKLKK